MDDHVTFGVSSHEFTEVLRLDKDGMHYKGEVIKDAGEAHKVFLSVMKHMKEEADVHGGSWVWWRDPMAILIFAIGLCVGLILAGAWV